MRDARSEALAGSSAFLGAEPVGCPFLHAAPLELGIFPVRELYTCRSQGSLEAFGIVADDLGYLGRFGIKRGLGGGGGGDCGLPIAECGFKTEAEREDPSSQGPRSKSG